MTRLSILALFCAASGRFLCRTRGFRALGAPPPQPSPHAGREQADLPPACGGIRGGAFVAALSLFALSTSTAFGQTRPVLTISFDKDLNGMGRDGPVAGTPVGKPELAPGKFGQALKAGSGTGFVDYPTRGILSPAGGTVEMWVCPLDWQPADGKFHCFFEAKGEGALYLYKYWVGDPLLMLTCDNLQGPYASSQITAKDWKPGEWHHVAGMWSSAGVMSYIDGKPAGKEPVPGNLPKAFGPTFRIGDQPWQFPRDTASLVDEVRIHDRALNPAHIAAHFAGNYGFALPLTAQATRFTLDVDVLSRQVALRLDTAGADVEDTRIQARTALVAKGAALPADAAVVSFAGGQASTALPLGDRKPGQYEVVAGVVVDGKPAFELRQALVVPTTEWLGSRIGLDDEVLPPWTPLRLQVNGRVGERGSGRMASRVPARPPSDPPALPLLSRPTRHPHSPAQRVSVQCWGRSYSLAGMGLPGQVTSAGADVLARPVALRLSSSGQAVAWGQPTLRLRSASPTRAILEGTAIAQIGEPPEAAPTAQAPPVTHHVSRFTTRVTAEYDGLLLYEISCDQPDRLPLDGMSLEIPVRAGHALYRHRYAATWIPLSGSVPPGEGVVDKTAFVPFAWLGDNDRGLFWFCESDEMWPNAAKENALEIARSGKEIVLRLNLLAPGQKLPANWKLVFGLQATPVKPIPKGWRKWRMAGNSPVPKANVEIVWPNAKAKDSLSDFGFPQAADPKTFRTYVNGLHKKGRKAVPYLCLTYVTDRPPEWRYFHKIWEMGSLDPSIPDAGWDHRFAMVSPVGKGYSDWIMTRTKQFLERYGIDGVYHDQTHPYTSASTLSGVGYVRDGKAYVSHPILGYRALYRRNYAIVKALPRPTFTQAHMSGKVKIPVLAYDDSYLDGEHFRDVVKDSYLDVMTLDSFRAEYMGRQWGLMPFFLPEFDAEHAKQVEPTRGMMGLLMIHDVSPWPIWCNTAVVNQAFNALDAFGYVDADFIPYFDATPPAATEMKDVYASAYKRRDGRALLVVANLSKEDREGEVRINARRLGLPLGKVVSWPDKQPLAAASGSVHLIVPRLGYRMLVLTR